MDIAACQARRLEYNDRSATTELGRARDRLWRSPLGAASRQVGFITRGDKYLAQPQIDP